jgi:peptidoglycan/LPS O-acetylase OafA/YrhL
MTTAKPLSVPPVTGGRMIQLDVLRGIAILLVLFRHTVLPWSYAGKLQPLMYHLYCLGWTGVDLFFVLSGFLIGGLLFNEIKHTGKLNVKRFLIRRGFKIWPAYIVFMAFVFLVLARHNSITETWRLTWANWVHLQNYFGTTRGHTWSLAVEEHFYLLLPVFLLLVIPFRRADGSMPAIPIAALTLIIVCTTLRILINPRLPLTWLNMIGPTHMRIDSLFFGVMLAYFYHLHPKELANLARHRFGLILLGLALISPMAFIDQLNSPFVYTVGFTMLYVGYGCILLAFVHTKPGDGLLGKAMRSPFAAILAWIGVFSYSIYLWQSEVAQQFTMRLLPHLPQKPVSLLWLITTVLDIAGAILFGALMAKLIEMPVLSLRERLFPRQERAVPKPAPAEMTEAQVPGVLIAETTSVPASS